MLAQGRERIGEGEPSVSKPRVEPDSGAVGGDRRRVVVARLVSQAERVVRARLMGREGGGLLEPEDRFGVEALAVEDEAKLLEDAGVGRSQTGGMQKWNAAASGLRRRTRARA